MSVPGPKVVITVTDDGPGLPEAARDAVVGRGIGLDERRSGGGLVTTLRLPHAVTKKAP